MSQFILIQVGQCGNQIGSCFLPQLLQEYNFLTKLPNKNQFELQQFLASFFSFRDGDDVSSILDNKKTKARIICIDMEDSVVSRFKNGQYKHLYEKRCLITNYPGSGNNWAEGFYSHGPVYKEKILTAIQYWVERCDQLHAFLVLFSVGGGTGSGLGSYILKLLADYFPDIERFVVPVYPTGTEDVITCPYNIAFATEKLLEYSTCTFPVENRAILDIIAKITNRYTTPLKNKSIYRPFEDLNSIIVDMLLYLTSGSRFPGPLNFDLNEINTNLVPFPNLKFLSSGFSPIGYKNVKCANKQVKSELFNTSISRTNQLLKIDPLNPKSVMLSILILGRGDYNLEDMNSYINKLQSRSRFNSWSNKSVKIGLCNIPPPGTDFGVLTLVNTTGMSYLFENISTQFMKLYQRKAHVHHYVNISDFEVNYFEDCQNSLNDVIDLYKSFKK